MEETIVKIARRLEEKRYGKYRGLVTDNRDPHKKGRLKLRIPSLLGDEQSDWALPCFPFGGGSSYGWFSVPDVDAQVWVEFEEGDLSRPIWTGTFWQAPDEIPEDAAKEEPSTRMLKTPGGHILQFDDESGEEQILLQHTSEAQLKIDKNGSIELTDSKGATLTMDAEKGEMLIEDTNGNSITLSSGSVSVEDSSSNKIELTPSGINVEGQMIVIKGSQISLGGPGGEPVIRGSSFISMYMNHIHPTPFGPSGPPVPQGESGTLSTKVTAF